MVENAEGSNRKTQFIHTAYKLFNLKGYQQTSVQDILDEIGLSRGAFYYYFDSKEDLLEEIALNIVNKQLDIPKEIESREDLSALEKINEYIRQLIFFKTENLGKYIPMVTEVYGNNKNLELEKKVLKKSEELFKPIIESMIEQGIKEGSFDVSYPGEIASLYIKLFIAYGAEIGELYMKLKEDKKALENLRRKYLFFGSVIEKILGLDKGVILIKDIVDEALQSVKEYYQIKDLYNT
ncbi:TetR/AcrR family transcriptional regulator [Natronospora cellulosivora (SeqCode)]